MWASCAAAAFLCGLGLRAEVVSAGLQVYLAGPGGITAPGLSLGHPDPSTGHPGLHNVVLISEGRRRWLLETSVWQTHRSRFGDLPDLMLAEVPPQTPGLGLFRQHFERFGAEFVAAVTDARPGGAVGLGWGLMRARTEWRTGPDARPERARAVARKLEAIRAGRARLVPV
ncbi:hypothetical protein JYK14_07855 [Siccirubricoccus sp. KC 17139]|uniref:Uncharacterized protein n=1 Tax=Siccirubricoccus soli TaxID=2899147 RepID=A0ABT1D4F4_9PROT|nr:hypothetical protein [Siccirubricoccus soli]MCO6416084.1 hypothetical protein [Siccirubricoccus soli]MCP2682216.1 hypothetical protein [Siccirubricoccus soli]